jgi:hypothetical protein
MKECFLRGSGVLALALALVAGCSDSSGDDPRLSAIDPDHGSARGGEMITLHGENLQGAQRVRFGPYDATDLSVGDNGTTLTVVTPLAMAGTVDVTVECGDGGSVTRIAGFTFDPLDLQYEDYSSRFPAGAGRSRGVALIDVEGDGDLDVVIGVRDAPNRVLLNDGAGNFTESDTALPEATAEPPVAEDSLDVAAADLDGDGWDDLIIANYSDQADRLYLNQGDGTFGDFSDLLPAVATRSHGLATGDVDGDGDLDIVVGVVGQNRVIRNLLQEQGALGFEEDEEALPVATNTTVRVVLSDVDRDGDLDLLAANDQATDPVVLLVNDASGLFTPAAAGQLPGQTEPCRKILAVDLTGDDAPELVALNKGQNRLYLNDGTGHFFDDTLRTLPFDRVQANEAAAFDADRDGDLDLAIAVYGATNRLYLNDGTGVLRDYTTRLPLDDHHSIDVVAADFDDDGDVDLIFTNALDEPDLYYVSVPPWGS